jgi:hypothetical protein
MDTGNSLVFHDIPVEVLRLGAAWSEPILPDPTVHMSLNPSFRKFSAFIDRLKHMGMTDVRVSISKVDSFADITLVTESESSRASIVIYGNPLVGGPDDISRITPVTQVTLTLSGFGFILGKVASPGNFRCMLMAREHMYLSIWIQLPQQYGIIAAVTPAILVS